MEPKPDQVSMVASLLESVGGFLHERNNALGLLDEPEQVKLQMKAQPLPVHRQEFESRVLLYLSLLELEQFLVLKKGFALGLSRERARRFWRQTQTTVAVLSKPSSLSRVGRLFRQLV